MNFVMSLWPFIALVFNELWLSPTVHSVRRHKPTMTVHDELLPLSIDDDFVGFCTKGRLHQTNLSTFLFSTFGFVA